jgi:energy-coupling factor transport system permease protein
MPSLCPTTTEGTTVKRLDELLRQDRDRDGAAHLSAAGGGKAKRGSAASPAPVPAPAPAPHTFAPAAPGCNESAVARGGDPSTPDLSPQLSAPRAADAAPARARRRRWAGTPPAHGLAAVHPLAALACVAALMLAGFVIANPFQVGLLLLVLLLVLAFAGRLRAAWPYLRFALYIAVFLAIINPLVSRGGVTVLWEMEFGPFELKLTLQGIYYGLGTALRLCVVVAAFALYNVLLDADEQLGIMSAVSFRSGLIVSLATRLFPVLSRDAAHIADAQRSRGVELDRGRWRRRVAARLPLLGALLSQSLERAMDVAESMEARGYGRRGRTRWRRGRRWRATDIAVLALSALSLIVLVVGLVTGAFKYSYFPLLDDPMTGFTAATWLVTLALLVAACLLAPLARELGRQRTKAVAKATAVAQMAADSAADRAAAATGSTATAIRPAGPPGGSPVARGSGR